ncbi:MAG: DEAD/DEAH box helicase, partial [Thermoleophilia bacterium]|nr:DEAD/DEAH box helicase [Thermoleophilia bacterium]
GIVNLHAFQREAIDLIRSGEHVVLAGGTGSGKSLCYQLPILDRLRTEKAATALYLAPTKALAQDQARRLLQFGARWARPALYDGDTPRSQRAVIRRTANLLLTNPDMLQAGILPGHTEWGNFLHGLRYVIVDESHVYRGVFGSHTAMVLRRLRRLARYYGADPVFILSSGTIANPVEHAEALTSCERVLLVDDHGAPTGGRDIVLWNPELDEEDGTRDSPLGDASRIYADLVAAGIPTIVFARTRKACELIHRFTVDRLVSMGHEETADHIAPYRAGYTPEQRRETERALAAGDLVGVVATNALELGIDIGALEAAVCVTFPGSVTSLRQQWGRAGRGVRRGLSVLIAGPDALDQYFMGDPDALLDRPVESARISLVNQRILLPHVAAAACELPIADTDRQLFDEHALTLAISELIATGDAREAPNGIAYIGRDRPASDISLRSSDAGSVAIIEADSGQLLGTVEASRAPTSVYPGAVYLHRGVVHLVRELDEETMTAVVEQRVLDYYTLPKTDTDITVLETTSVRLVGKLAVCIGTVEVEEQLVAYQRSSVTTHAVIDVVAQTLPPVRYTTEAVWFAPPKRALDDIGVVDMLGALHAAEHAMIAMLPLLAICDRADIGGLSIDFHEVTDAPTIFVYDGHPGGVGITAAGFELFERWVSVTLDMLERCPCERGCPSCVQSPKCGNLNEPLSKAGAITLLKSVAGG